MARFQVTVRRTVVLEKTIEVCCATRRKAAHLAELAAANLSDADMDDTTATEQVMSDPILIEDPPSPPVS